MLQNGLLERVLEGRKAFGMGIKNREYVAFKDFRYSFNGQEKDNEISGDGNSYDFGARTYDSRISKFLSIDPYCQKYPEDAPYSFAGANPIALIDKNGEFKISPENMAAYRKDYPHLIKYLETQVEKDYAKSAKLINGLIKMNPEIDKSTILGIAKWDQGPEIVFTDNLGEFPVQFTGAAGYTSQDNTEIQLNSRYAAYLEKVLSSGAGNKVKLVAFARFYFTLTHEVGHFLSRYKNKQKVDNKTVYERKDDADIKGEAGYQAQENIWGTDSYKPNSNPSGETTPGIEGISSETYQPGKMEQIVDDVSKTQEGKDSLPTVPQ